MFRIPLSVYQLENLYPKTDIGKPTPQDPPGHRWGTITTTFGVMLKFTYDGSQATFNIVENPKTLTEVAIKAQMEHDAAMLGVAEMLDR